MGPEETSRMVWMMVWTSASVGAAALSSCSARGLGTWAPFILEYQDQGRQCRGWEWAQSIEGGNTPHQTIRITEVVRNKRGRYVQCTEYVPI